MNKRIRELVKQAGIDLPDDTVYNGHIYKNSIERLAQLIVKECIDIVKPTEHHEVWAEDYVGGLEGLELLDHRVAKLKEHFGVE
jgi:uncharacterized protein (DUF1015 family)